MNTVRPGPVSKGLPALCAGGGVVVEPLLAIELVDAGGEDRLGARRVVAADQLFHADGQADLGLARQHILPGPVEGEGGGGAAAFDVDHRHALGEQPVFDQRREGDLAADATLPPLAHAAVAEPGLLDQPRALRVQAAVEQQIGVGPSGQVLEGLLLVLAEGRAGGTDDVDIAHGVVSQVVSAAAVSGKRGRSHRPPHPVPPILQALIRR